MINKRVLSASFILMVPLTTISLHASSGVEEQLILKKNINVTIRLNSLKTIVSLDSVMITTGYWMQDRLTYSD